MPKTAHEFAVAENRLKQFAYIESEDGVRAYVRIQGDRLVPLTDSDRVFLIEEGRIERDLTTEEGRQLAIRDAEFYALNDRQPEAVAVFTAVGAAEVEYAGATDHGDLDDYENLPDGDTPDRPDQPDDVQAKADDEAVYRTGDATGPALEVDGDGVREVR